MNIYEFLTPVSFHTKPENYSNYQIIELLRFEDLDEIDDNSIVICGLAEYKNIEEVESNFLDKFRNHFYQLSRSNWSKKIYDIGTIIKGNTFEDSCFALHQVAVEIVKRNAVLVVIGGSQALSYVLYQTLQKDLSKVGTIDIKLDIDGFLDDLTPNNHITKMILNEESRLLEFYNLGSQAPYVAKEELDVLEQLNFENIRLGQLTGNLSLAEQYLRELDLLSVDMNVMQHASFNSTLIPTPNGLNTREICGLLRYAGLNKSLKILHISNFNPDLSSIDSYTLAEMLWYFIEAQNNQKSDGNLMTYRVLMEEEEIIFIKSNNSERWWLEMTIDGMKRKIPCSYSDYQTAMQGEFPDIWLKFYKKFY